MSPGPADGNLPAFDRPRWSGTARGADITTMSFAFITELPTAGVVAASRGSVVCPSCGGAKLSRKGMCGACWASLTEPQRGYLRSIKDSQGEAVALREALEQIEAAELHLPEAENDRVSLPLAGADAAPAPLWAALSSGDPWRDEQLPGGV
jgi:hypothetical protein